MARTRADLTRQELERDERERLALWAMRSGDARRALPLDREGRIFDYRTEFQRDRDRILHARAFRRLRLKSNGGAVPPSERYRDRLTHTLEVSQISRTVARGLALNEDLVEAIALGHEIGMPPFGRPGEAALAALLEDGGGFSVSAQSLRVVDLIEKRYRHPGLNLTDLTREGIMKQGPYDRSGAGTDEDMLHAGWPPFPEAQVVALVDRVGSGIQDLDDGLRAGALDIDEVETLPIVKVLIRRTGAQRGSGRRGGLFMRANAINRGLTHLLVTGIIHHSRRALRAWARAASIDSHEAFLAARRSLPADVIGLTPAAARMYDSLGAFVSRKLHQGAWLRGAAARATRVLGGIFRAITDDPRLAEDYLLLRFRDENGGPYLRDLDPAQMDTEIARRYRGDGRFARLVIDHIAGMTDAFATAEHDRLQGPVPAGGHAG